ncbi:unnamed protein product [Ilex paraguariensis]|uniref:Uncharacterized protein n=1 Tax=Ilex paraguariensis TaxID=185542 RepID=A0ABC8TH38_9AQUA
MKNSLVKVETSTGSVFPASFDRTSRCPDEIVRRIRVTVCFEDPHWTGRLLETYDTQTDRFVIAPCTWKWDYLFQHPDWREAFPLRQPRVFERASGSWRRRLVK